MHAGGFKDGVKASSEPVVMAAKAEKKEDSGRERGRERRGWMLDTHSHLATQNLQNNVVDG